MTRMATPEKRTLFEDLVHLYKETSDTHQEEEKLFKACLEKKTYEMVPQLNATVENYSKFKKSLKNILKEHYQTELETEISRLEKEEEKESKMNESIWRDYGSELAGDFNAKEVKIRKKINLLKGILK